MSSQDHDAKILPKPIALTLDQLHQVAAGTAAMLPPVSSVIALRPIIAGPFPVMPQQVNFVAGM
jgi:hypothetical protein